MNIEELTYLGAQAAGGIVGGLKGLTTVGLGAGVGGFVLGVATGWALCFFPFLLARAFEDKDKKQAAKVSWTLGFSAPLLAPLLMSFLW